MQMQIWIAAGIVLTGVAYLARRWKRRALGAPSFSSEPVSGEWLAEARAREDHSS
jgi:hypothetical protein